MPTPRPRFPDVARDNELRRAISSFLNWLTRDASLIDDVTQDVLIMAYRRENAEGAYPTLSYLMASARNRLISVLRRNRAIGLPVDFDPPQSSCEPIDQSIEREEREILWSAIKSLPAIYRESIDNYLRPAGDGVKIKRTATSRTQEHRARKMLRKALAAHFGVEEF